MAKRRKPVAIDAQGCPRFKDKSYGLIRGLSDADVAKWYAKVTKLHEALTPVIMPGPRPPPVVRKPKRIKVTKIPTVPANAAETKRIAREMLAVIDNPIGFMAKNKK